MKRATLRRHIDTRDMRLGRVELGDGTTMGGFATIPTGGLEAWLYANESDTGIGEPWAREAPRRLHSRVLPHLVDTSLLLTVVLVLRDQSGHARIEPTHHLGYEPIIEQPGVPPQARPDEPRHPRQAVLFSGDTSRAPLTQ